MVGVASLLLVGFYIDERQAGASVQHTHTTIESV